MADENNLSEISPENPVQTENQAADIPSVAQDPPAAATTVMDDNSERLAELEAELEVARAELATTRSGREKLERDVSYLQNELQQLRNPAPPSGAPAAHKEKPADDHCTKEFGL
jgi:septal ring factor EnvC (AmiA/AmiB activator)